MHAFIFIAYIGKQEEGTATNHRKPANFHHIDLYYKIGRSRGWRFRSRCDRLVIS